MATRTKAVKATAAKKAPAKKATAKRRPLSPEARAKLAQNLVKARAARAAKAKANPRPPVTKRGGGRRAGPLSPETAASQRERTERTKVVKTYLATLIGADGSVTEAPMTTVLTGIPGIKAGKSNDPDRIEAAADVIESQIPATLDPLKRLKQIRRMRTLRELVVRLRDTNGNGDPTHGFIGVGKEWCEERGYTYFDMRDFGVPAAILKEAGIER